MVACSTWNFHHGDGRAFYTPPQCPTSPCPTMFTPHSQFSGPAPPTLKDYKDAQPVPCFDNRHPQYPYPLPGTSPLNPKPPRPPHIQAQYTAPLISTYASPKKSPFKHRGQRQASVSVSHPSGPNEVIKLGCLTHHDHDYDHDYDDDGILRGKQYVGRWQGPKSVFCCTGTRGAGTQGCGCIGET